MGKRENTPDRRTRTYEGVGLWSYHRSSHVWATEVHFSSIPPSSTSCLLFPLHALTLSLHFSLLSETPNHLPLIIRLIFKITALLTSILNTCVSFLWLPQQMITTEIYHLLVVEAWSLKSRCQQGHTLLGGSREGCFLASSTFSGCWHSLASLLCDHIPPVSDSVFTLPSSLSACVSHFPLLFS